MLFAPAGMHSFLDNFVFWTIWLRLKLPVNIFLISPYTVGCSQDVPWGDESGTAGVFDKWQNEWEIYLGVNLVIADINVLTVGNGVNAGNKR